MTQVDRLKDTFGSSTQDAELVARCREGSEVAWAELIDKYKNLIYSVPARMGFSPFDAGEIFQDVCSTLLVELNHIREPRALAGWLVTTATRSAYRLRKQQSRSEPLNESLVENAEETAELPEQILRRIQQDQLIRDSVESLEVQCRNLVRLLFFTEPPIPYNEAAAKLGLATGSMGATRMRCLAKLRRQLESRGLP